MTAACRGGGDEDDNRIGEVEEHRSFLEIGGDAEVGDGDCKSSKNDLLPQTIADILLSHLQMFNQITIQLILWSAVKDLGIVI